MGNDELATAKISVWWDIENCNVPQNIDPNAVASNIRLALRRANLHGSISISAFGDTKCLKVTTQEALSSTGIDFNHVPRGNKEAADKAILVGMLFWALDNSPPAHFLLISGDGDFANALHRLRMKRYNILLARPDHYVKRALLASATNVWFWSSLARGEVVISQPSESTEDNLPIQGGGGYSNGSNEPSIKRVISTRPPNQALTPSSSSSLSSLSSIDLDQHFPSSREGSSCFDPSKVGVSVASVNGRFSSVEDLNMGGLHLQGEMCNPKSTYSPIKHRQNQSHPEPSNAMCGATSLDWNSNSPLRNNSGHIHPRGGGPLFSESRPPPSPQPICSLCFPPRVNNKLGVGGPLGGRGWVDDDGFGQEGGGRVCPPLPKTRITTENIRLSTTEFQAGNSFLTMAHKAIVTLKGDMLAPTEMNLLECIQCWETQSVVENLNLRQVLENAVECGEMKVLGVGNGAAAVGGFRMFLPTKSELWSCVDPKNMQLEHPKELWVDLHQFLLSKEGQQSLAMSRSR